MCDIYIHTTAIWIQYTAEIGYISHSFIRNSPYFAGLLWRVIFHFFYAGEVITVSRKQLYRNFFVFCSGIESVASFALNATKFFTTLAAGMGI